MGAVQFAYFEIDGQIIHSVKSGDVNVEDTQADVILTLSPNPYALGHRRGVDMVDFTLEVLPMYPAEFDWHGWQKSHASKTINYEESTNRDSSGQRYMLTNAQAYSVSTTHNADGDNGYTVSGKALRHLVEP